MRYWIDDQIKPEILELYQAGYSSLEIKELLKLETTARSIQRLIKAAGLSRSVGDAFRLAVNKGRVPYERNPNKIRRKRLATRLRLETLQRFNFRCNYCGNTAVQAQLEVDHIDNNPNNNQPDNLQILCNLCNIGKSKLQ